MELVLALGATEGRRVGVLLGARDTEGIAETVGVNVGEVVVGLNEGRRVGVAVGEGVGPLEGSSEGLEVVTVLGTVYGTDW